MIVWTASATSPALLSNISNQAQSGSARDASISAQKEDLVGFEQNARKLAASDSPQAYQTLLQSLNQGEPRSPRDIVLKALNDASPAVVPALMIALSDSDPSVRAGAAQVLGMRREYQAIAALTEATRDPNASVRLQVVKTLSTMDAWQVLPRLEQLQVNEPNSDVRQAASAAKETSKRSMAQGIGIPASGLRDISVTTSDLPKFYAVTSADLYTHDGTKWKLVSRLPDAPLQLATADDPKLIYLATVSSGLYRSLNGGETWEHVQFGLQTPTQLTVSAIVADPQNARQLYIVLAAQGTKSGGKDAMGIYASKDSGVSWTPLPDSPMDLMSTRLVIDPQWHGYLFGLTADTTWRYALPD